MNPKQVMKYLNDYGFKKLYNKKKSEFSTERLILESVEKYLVRWGYSVSDNWKQGSKPRKMHRCTDEQYFGFIMFIEDVYDKYHESKGFYV
jgi:hypothetical protein